MGVWVTDSTKKGWLTAILELGAWVGCLYSGFVAEILSRKYAILISTGIFIVGVIVQVTSVTGSGASSILGGRFITGMGVGALSMIVPMYNAEVAPPEVRGALIGLQQLAITTGIMISFWIGKSTIHYAFKRPRSLIVSGQTTAPTTLVVPAKVSMTLLGLYHCRSSSFQRCFSESEW